VTTETVTTTTVKKYHTGQRAWFCVVELLVSRWYDATLQQLHSVSCRLHQKIYHLLGNNAYKHVTPGKLGRWNINQN